MRLFTLLRHGGFGVLVIVNMGFCFVEQGSRREKNVPEPEEVAGDKLSDAMLRPQEGHGWQAFVDCVGREFLDLDFP